MRTIKLIAAIATLALSMLACSLNFVGDFQGPETVQKTTSPITELITIPVPDAQDVDLTIAIGAGKLELNPGAQDGLVVGTITYNVTDFKPGFTSENGVVRLEQGNFKLDGIPSFDRDIKNDWNLALANQEMTLRIKAGAYEGEFELGGLSLKDLYVEDGASNVTLTFSEPNQTEMRVLNYSTGASNVTLENLANANFTSMIFRSGLGNYTLDFSGTLQRDCTVNISSGLSNVKLLIPEGVSARVNVESSLTKVNTRGAWESNGNFYIQNGTGPTITIQIDLGAGQLELTNP